MRSVQQPSKKTIFLTNSIIPGLTARDSFLEKSAPKPYKLPIGDRILVFLLALGCTRAAGYASNEAKSIRASRAGYFVGFV